MLIKKKSDFWLKPSRQKTSCDVADKSLLSVVYLLAVK